MDIIESVRDAYEEIINVIEICDSCLSMLGIDSLDFESNLNEQLSVKHFDRWERISKSVSEAFMETTSILIREKYPNLHMEYYIDGLDTELYLNRELYQVGDKKDKFVKESDKDSVEIP